MSICRDKNKPYQPKLIGLTYCNGTAEQASGSNGYDTHVPAKRDSDRTGYSPSDVHDASDDHGASDASAPSDARGANDVRPSDGRDEIRDLLGNLFRHGTHGRRGGQL